VHQQGQGPQEIRVRLQGVGGHNLERQLDCRRRSLHDNPFDVHTLKGALQQIKRLIGWEAANAYVVKGNKGYPKQLGSTAIHLANRRKKSMKPSESRWFKRRSAIEPVIGHMKQDNRMDRNYLKGTNGDKMNAILAACGFNLRKLLRAILWLLFKELERLKVPLIRFRFSLRAPGAIV
jgi:IS5 family transposase